MCPPACIGSARWRSPSLRSLRVRIGYLKRHFGYAKVRYRGLAKNTQRIAGQLGFSNLLIARRYATD